MNTSIRDDILQNWKLDRQSAQGFLPREVQRAHEKAAQMGRTGTALAAAQLFAAVTVELAARGNRLIAQAKEVLTAHGEPSTPDLDEDLKRHFDRTIAVDVRDYIDAIRTAAGVNSSVISPQAVTGLNHGKDQLNHAFKLMLIATRTGANAKSTASMNISHSQVQIGDFNTQNNQQTVNFFRSIVASIDASNHTTEQKTEAKSILSQFLEHPVVAASVGAIATKVFVG